MNQKTVDSLVSSGSWLYGFKVVGCQDRSCLPLVWFQTKEFSCQTYVPWEEKDEAYTSFSSLGGPVAQIAVADAREIELGQTLKIDSPSLTGKVCGGVVPQGISIENRTTRSFTCGIRQLYKDSFLPICATPIHVGSSQIFAPLKKVMLWFSTQDLPPGRTIRNAYGPGILIDLNDAPERTVSYDMETLWSWGNNIWAKKIEAMSNIVDRLIVDLPFQPPHTTR
ncbi:hypothetical protein [Polyangium sorediatum]|uniref:Uncharacterized protein n=1 Tax=Polyangium sorediatum TaxID=889274 RepID=A0ABT6P9Z4_9BACT|nr:hypothetical protein [Polyangium sorediatum]MDI1437451.1 hypothetical protein [Polyangium sorediatum]